MTGIENLVRIRDQASVANIRQITDCFVSQINPLKVILFGSFADGTYTEDSDYDFYIVVNDGRNISETSYQAYKSIRDVMIRPVDIVVGTNTRFESKSRGSPFRRPQKSGDHCPSFYRQPEFLCSCIHI